MIFKLNKHYREILSILMTLIMLAGLLGSATTAIAADSTAALAAGSTNGEAGETVSIPISLTSAGDAVAVQFDLYYDSTQLTYVKTTRGNLINLKNEEEEYIFSVDKTPISDDAGSRVRVMVYSSTNTMIASGTDTVVDIQFSVNDGVTGEQTSVLDLDGVIIGDIAGDKISTSVTDGQFSGVNVAVTGVSLDQTSGTVNAGDSFQLTATISPENASNRTLIWTTSNSDVAAVDQSGLVTGISAGTADITVTTEDGEYTAVCTFTVYDTGMGILNIVSLLPGYKSGTVVVTLAGTPGENNSFVYTTGDSEVSGLSSGSTVTDGKNFSSTGTAAITVTSGQYLTIYEINATSKEVVKYICRQIGDSDLNGTTIGDYYVYLDSIANTAILISYNGAGGDVVIPATLSFESTDYSVTATANAGSSTTGVFYSVKSTLTSVTFPDSLTFVGRYTFSRCTGLTSAVIESGLTYGSYIYYACTGLSSVTIESGVTTIPMGCFYGCTGLDAVSLPDSVTTIESRAFQGCTGFTSVTLESDINYSSYSYYNCTGLTSVTIEDGVTVIPEWIFYKANLISITLPGSVASVGESAFGYCSNLVSAYFEGEKPEMTTPFEYTADNFAVYYYFTLAAGWSGYLDYPSSAYCRLTLNPNYSGGTETTANVPVDGSNHLLYPGTTPLLSGYIFNGWYKEAECTNVWDFNNDTVTGDVVLFAGWLAGTPPGSLEIASIVASATCNGATVITLSSSAGTDNSLVYQLSGNPVYGLTSGSVITDGLPFTSGEMYYFSSGQYVVIYEINTATGTVVNYVCHQMSSAEIKPGAGYDGLNFTLSGTTAAVSGYGGSAVDLVIPETVNFNGTDYTVTGIESADSSVNGVFYNAASFLASVSLPDSLTSIGDYAFYGCTALNSITPGCGPISIGAYAFYNCAAFSPDLLTTDLNGVGEYAFFGTPGPAALNISNGAVGTYALSGCTNLVSLTLGDGVTSIGDYAFQGCSGLVALIIPDSVTSLGESACKDCTALVTVSLGDGIADIGSNAFNGCSNLASLTLGKNLTSIGYCAFMNCSSLTDLTIVSDLESIGIQAFYYCTSLTSIVLPDSTTEIGNIAFFNCHEIASVELGSGLKSIGYLAFSRLGITSLIIPDSVTEIGESAFSRCSNLSSVTLGSGLTFLASNIFENCASIASITIPAGISSIGGYAFGNCTALSSVYFLGAMPVFGTAPFNGITSDLTLYYHISLADAWSGLTDYTGSAYCVLSLNPNYSDGQTTSLYVAVDSSGHISVPEDACRTDYVFQGWYKDSGCTNLWDFGNDTVTGDLTLYAGWVIESAGSLDIVSVLPGYDAGKVVVTISNTLGDGNSFKYKVSDEPVSGLTKDITVTDGSSFSSRGIYAITVTADQYITVYEINSTTKTVVNYVCRQITAGDITGTTSGDFYVHLNTDNHTATLIKYTGSSTSVEIPGTITVDGTDYTLTAIANGSSTSTGAFKAIQTQMNSVTIPDSITYIGAYAFNGCTQLTSVTLKSGVTYGVYIYNSCSGLTSLSIESGVTAITESMFRGCTSLTSVEIPESVTTIDQNAFSGCNGLTSVTVKNGVTYGSGVYSNCKGLTAATIASGAVAGETIFSGCTALNDLTIEEGVTEIPVGAFNGCTGLTTVTIPSSVSSVGDKAFYKCTGLTATTFMAGVTYGTEVYCYCSGLTSLTIEDGVTSLPEGAFICCTGLTTVDIPDSVNSIGNNAFLSCTGLTSATIKNGITYGTYVYSGCTGLTSLTIENGVTGLPVMIFNGCTGLTGLVLPDSLTSLSQGAFNGCSGLNSLDLGNGLSELGSSSFCGCTGLTAVTIPDSVTSIGGAAFSSCTSLLSINLPDSVTTLGDNAFTNCPALTTLTIPDSLTVLGNNVFMNCSGLTSIDLGSSLNSIGNYAFSNCTSLTSITFPSGVSTIGDSACNGCTLLSAAYFQGNQPEFKTLVFNNTASGFTVYYHISCSDSWSGFTTYTSSPYCVLTQDLNYSGSALINTNSAVDGSGHLTAPSEPSREHYAFNGWFKDSSCTSVFDFDTEVVNGDLTLYAGWTSVIASVSVTGVALDQSAVTLAMDCTLQLTAIVEPASAANRNVTWSSDNTSVATVDAGGLVTAAGTGTANVTVTTEDGDYTAACEVTVVSLGSLTINTILPGYNSGTVMITLADSLGSGHSFVYKIGDSEVSGLAYGDTVTDGTAFSSNGAALTVASGKYVTLYEINSTSKYVVNYISHLVTESEAAGTTVDDFYVALSTTGGNTATIIKYTGSSTEVTVPASLTVDGTEYTVTALANGTSSTGIFTAVKSSITALTLPDSITAIGNYAFYGCTKLASITLPESATSLGIQVFRNCSSLTSITLPAGIPSIENGVFQNCAKLESVVIPESVKKIGTYVFYSCSKLTSITLPDNIVSLGDSAFQSCITLSSVTLSNNLISIGKSAFQNCSKLASIYLPASVNNLSSSIFVGCHSLKAAYFQGSLPLAFGTSVFSNTASDFVLYYYLNQALSWSGFTDYTVAPFCLLTLDPNYSEGAVEVIFSAVDSTNHAAYPVEIPLRPDYTFNGWYKDAACTDNWDFTADTVIGDFTLYAAWLSGVAPGSLTITSVLASSTNNGATVVTLENAAGTDNSLVYRITSVPISGVTTDSTVTDGSAFTSGGSIPIKTGEYLTIYEINTTTQCVVNYVCRQLASFEIRPGVTIGDLGYVFSGTTAMVNNYAGSGGAVDIPGSLEYEGTTYTVTSIAGGTSNTSGVFYSGTTSIREVSIPDSVITIGDYAFYGCSALTSITLGSGVNEIGAWALSRCTGLSSIAIPAGVTTLGEYAFFGCSGLTSITVPAGITSMGDCVFQGCTGLTSITLENGLSAISPAAFYGCSELTSITFPESITVIPDSAFSGCSKLNSITFPAGLSEIGPGAFARCPSLTQAVLPDNVTLGNAIYVDCSGLTSIIIEDGVVTIPDSSFANCYSLTEISIPESVTSINFAAFSNCQALTSVTIPVNVTSLGNTVFQGCSNLVGAYFAGNLPTLGTNPFISTASGFTVYYHVSRSESWSGFSTYASSAYCLLTLDPNYGGSTVTVVYTALDGSGYVAAPADPSRESYTFNGWYKDSACTSVFDFTSEVITGDLTLYAGWTAEAVWDGSTNTAWYNTSDSSFTLTTPAQLAGLAAIVNGTAAGIEQDSFSTKNILLGSDMILAEDGLYTTEEVYFQDGSVDYSGTFTVPTINAGTQLWTPIGNSSYPFLGTFDGGSNTVNGLYTDVSAAYQGLFGYIGQGAMIENTTVSGVVAGQQYVGGITAVVNGASIQNCVNNALIYASGGAAAGGSGTSRAGHLGGIAGLGTGTADYPVSLTNCTNNGTVTCPNCAKGGRAGGIVGIFDLTSDYAVISKCCNTADITAYQYVGGITGGQFSNNVNIQRCYNNGTISGASSGKVYVAGICGISYGPIANCYNTGSVVSTATSGSIPTRFAGIAGETVSSTATIINCYSIGQVAGAQSPGTSGNIVGSQAVDPVNCYYLNSTAYSGACDTAATTSKTEAEMKDSTMPALLGSAFVLDSFNYNQGYPVLAWQNGVEETPVACAVTLSYDDTVAAVSASVAQAYAGDTVIISITNLVSGKQVQSVTVSDGCGTDFPVTTETANSCYSFTMGDYPVTVTVLFENSGTTGDAYAFSLDPDIDPIWTLEVSSSGLDGDTITSGSTVSVTVTRMADAISASLAGLQILDAAQQSVDYTTLSTTSGGYSTIKDGSFSFTMPASAVTIAPLVTYSEFSVYVQNGEEGTPVLVKTYSREDMLDIAGSETLYYTGYDKYPTAVIGKALQSVKLADLLTNAGLDFTSGDSIYLNALDNSYRTYSYDSLYGVDRYYYPNIAATESQDSGKTLLDSMLVIKGYQKRFIEFETGQTIDDMVCDTLNAYRFVYGQTEEQFNNGTPLVEYATVNDFLKYVTSLTLIQSEQQVEAWDGTTLDVSWYNTDATEFYISTPAQLAGLAAIVNGIYNSDITTIIGDSSCIQYNVGGGTVKDATTDTWIYGNETFEGKTVYLTADLDMGGVNEDGSWSGPNYMPVGGQYCMTDQDGTTLIGSSWCGTFDGQGHTVNNIYCSRHAGTLGYSFSQSIGLIGRMGLHDNDVDASYGLYPVVRNVAVTGYIYGNRSIGGIVGKNGQTGASIIENCVNYASISNTDSKGCGGIVGAGWNRLTISNCANLGSIYTSYKNAGGISGSCEAAVINCYNVGYVGASSTSQAQSLGTNNGSAVWTNCYWLTNSSASNQAVYGSTTGSTITEMPTTDSMKTAEFLAALNAGSQAWVYIDGINDGYPMPAIFAGPIPVTVSSVEFTSDPDRLSYGAGETFSTAGLVITALYSDGTTEAVTEYSVSNTAPLTSEDISITISGSFGGIDFSKTYTINVSASVVSFEVNGSAGYDSDFTVDIAVSQISDFNVADYTVTFDPALLRLDNVTRGLIENTEIPVEFNSPDAGSVIIVNNLNLAETGISGSGTLAVLHFHVLGEVGQTAEIEFSNGTLAANTADLITALWINGSTTFTQSEQTIDFAELYNKGLFADNFSIEAFSDSGLEVSFTASGNCTIEGNLIHITGVGECTITAHQSGNENYNAAPDVVRTFIVRPAGDANDDGLINALDITQTTLSILKLYEYDADAGSANLNDFDDADGNGLVNAQDIALIELLILNALP